MSRFDLRRAAMLAFAIPMLLGGCLGRSPGVEHFVLASQGPAKIGDAGLSAPAVLVGPVRLPAYLDRPQVARLGAGGSISLDEYTRWLGGFEENFLRAISFEVARQTNSSRVVAHPSKAPFEFDARVRLHVDDLVVVEGRTLRVRIRWVIAVAGAEDGLHVFEEDRPLADASNASIVAAHDAALAALAGEIAEAVERSTRGGEGQGR